MPRIEFCRNQAFLLEDSNLRRILGIVHSSFKDEYKLVFSVTLTSGKSLQFDSENDLLGHDNTVADPIHHLNVSATKNATESSCSVFFFGEKKPNLAGIAITVESEEQRWASALAAELDEQVERIKMLGFVYQMRQSVGFRNLINNLLIPLVLTLLVFATFIETSNFPRVQEERRELLRQAEAAKTTDQKIDFLLKSQVAALRDKSSESLSSALKVPKFDAKLAVGLLPFFLSFILLWYLLRHCYPPAVFAWGDTGRQFQRTLERRKNIWSIVLIAIALGFMVNISSPVISGWLGV